MVFIQEEYSDICWVRNSKRGLVDVFWGYPSEYIDDAPREIKAIKENLWFKSPGDVGGTYFWSTVSAKIMDKTKITVPAGTFQCTLYRFEYGDGD